VTSDYAPKPFLRQTENKLLRAYFGGKELLHEIDWDNLKETDVDAVYDAWQALPQQERVKIESDFQVIFDVASVDGVRILIEEGRYKGIDLKPGLDALGGFLNKSCWVFLNHSKHAHDLGHLGAGNALPAGDVCMVSALQLSSPSVQFVSEILGSLRKSP